MATDRADPRTAAGASAGRGDPLRDAYLKLEQAEGARKQRQFDRARVICEGLIRQYPTYFMALFTLGLVFIDTRKYPEAMSALSRAVMLDPQSWQALNALGAVYMRIGAHEMAVQTLERAAAIKSDEPTVLIALGEVLRDDHEYERARDTFRKAYTIDRDIPVAGAGLGRCCAELGFYAEAAQVFEELLARGTGHAAVVADLLELPSKFVSIDVAAALERVAGRRFEEDQQDYDSIVAYARAAILHRSGQHQAAWDQLVAANSRQGAALRREAALQANLQKENLTQLRPRAIVPTGDGGSGPMSLFILGTSRSGKTTLEALVARLDGVKIGYENPILTRAVRRAFQRSGLPTGTRLEMLPPQLDPLCRDLYREDLARRAGAARAFTNTHPGHIHEVARVAAAFPDVRFAFVKRDPDDTMFRIFTKSYRAGNVYAYDLRTIRDHVAWYHEMIDVLAGKLPGIARVIRYEDMVADPRAALATVAELCGLSMTDAVLPDIGDDRGCAAPYREAMAAALKA